MRFSSILITAAAAAATSSFSAVVCIVAATNEDDSHSTRRIRGRTAAKNLNSLLEFQEETESDQNSLFWNRNLEMSMSVEDDHDDHGDHDDNSSSNKDDVDACPSTPDPVDPEVVRAALRTFVETLDDAPLFTDFSPDKPGPSQYARAYHPNPEDQAKDYHLCTIVQQCQDPDFILAFGLMSAKSRGLAFNAASAAMSTESFLMLQLQEHSDMLLGEMQDWATTCDGTCRLLNDPNGLLEKDYTLTSSFVQQSTDIPDTNYEDCGKMRNTNFTFWYCNDEPRMIHVGNVDVVSDRYELGNVWNEPRIHARNAWHNFFSVYGDLEPNGASFGMRLSGHHTDVNFRWDDNGKLVQDTPVFLGHNPFVVPPTTPPLTRQSNERANASGFLHPLMWQNMAGIQQFAEAERLILVASKVLETSASKSYLPLKEWDSTPVLGGFSPAADLVDGNDEASLEMYSTWDLSTASQSDFDAVWALVEYTLKFSRGKQSTSAERDLFRREGKVIWTTSFPPELDQDPTDEQFDTNYLPNSGEDLRNTLTFLNLRIETEEWLYFSLVNSMFTVLSEFEPSNHLHSILLEKKWMTGDHACTNPTDPICAKLLEPDDPGHSHAHRYLF